MKHVEPPENLPVVPETPVPSKPENADDEPTEDVHFQDPKTGDTVATGQTAEPRDRAPASHPRRSLQSSPPTMNNSSNVAASVPMPDDMLEVRDVADRLRVSRAAVYRWVEHRHLPFYNLPGGIRFKVADVEAFIESRRTAARSTRQYGRTQDQR